MVNASADLKNRREQLIAEYHQLNSLEQLIVQLFSVLYEPVNRTTFASCLSWFGAQDPVGKSFTTNTLKPHLEKLLKAGVLLQESGQGPSCNPLLVEVATRDAVRTERFEAMVRAVHKVSPVNQRWKTGPRFFSTQALFIREVRIAFYRKDTKLINQLFQEYYQHSYQAQKITLDEIYQLICTNPFDREWFSTLPPDLYESVLSSILNNSMLHLTPADEAFALLKESSENKAASEKQPAISDLQRIGLIEQLILRGQLPAAQAQLEQLSEPYRTAAGNLQGALLFLTGKDSEAIAHYNSALQALKKNTGKRKIYFQTMSGLFFILALLKQGTRESLQQAAEYTGIARQANHWLSQTYLVLESLVKLQQGDLAQKDIVLYAAATPTSHSLDRLFYALSAYWIDAEWAKSRLVKGLDAFYTSAEAAGYDWLAMQAAELLSRLRSRSPYAKKAAAFHQQTGIRPLVDLIKPQETWELCLNALTHLRKEAPTETTKASSTLRLAWFITFYSNDNYAIEPREQRLSAKGGWSRGRPIALKRLKKAGEFDYLTPQDIQVCVQLEADYSYYGQTAYHFGEKAIVALIGHPFVFWEDASAARIDIVKGEPELLIKKGKHDQLTLQFSPSVNSDRAVLVVKETPTRLKVLELTEEHRRIAAILGSQNRLEVPASAKNRVIEAIGAVSGIVTVHSDIGGGVESAEEAPADAKPHIHLLPAGSGLKVAVLSRPFDQGGPYYRPGSGGETVIAEIEGKRLQTTRNLKEEKKLANAAIAALPTLARYDKQDNEWLVEDPEDCLELLLEIQTLADTVVVEWPEGEKLRVKHQAGLNNFKIKIQQQNDWFNTSGELQLDDTLVLDMQRLMGLLDQTSGRFLPLGDGQFLALTQEFRKRLDELRTYTEKSGKGLRLHPLAAVALEDWIDEVGSLQADKHWKTHIQRLKDLDTFEPELPSTLQAELRDYQIEGFRWLARLAHWGVGACLADDMGLGKTLQSLALILTRAPAGPTLIVAPTSVCMNWTSEAARFAPTLNVIQFGSGSRQKLLDNLQPFDMLVCSYGLLQQEELAGMLAQVQWKTIVLDEAQSIKNFATKRSQAAMNLQGEFKLLTTGTPIENHLGELWNLFRFINPGLLGSLESFNQRFAVPIERYGDRPTRQRLKKLIQPFLLRRTKNQVLEELPSRTEILLHVELSKEELAFYEALRQEAIAKLSETDATAGTKHLQVLAEIMRLRRACCNPRLVRPELALASSKLQLFSEVLAELLDNRHKALIFSQFVDHLHILREHLDQQKIRYQYLDGSTPAAERKKRVEAFQAGDGDVFLISLKAGGTGLNLTAADYVIHMDPWWNPAVEDQASDRAHRIGQQRPVTIYRLVAKNTIEEKIVELHHRKRDLADSLLEGTDVSGKISTDDLLQLIQTG